MYRWRNVEDEEVVDKLGVKADDAGFRRLVQPIPEMLLLAVIGMAQARKTSNMLHYNRWTSQSTMLLPSVRLHGDHVDHDDADRRTVSQEWKNCYKIKFKTPISSCQLKKQNIRIIAEKPL